MFDGEETPKESVNKDIPPVKKKGKKPGALKREENRL